MKRIVAIVLIMVMLLTVLPVSMPVKAATLGDSPFYCISMSSTENEIPYTYWMPFFWSNTVKEDTVWPSVSCYGANGEADLAEKLKEDFNARPEGTRYFQLCLLHTGFFGKVERVIFFDKAVEFVKEWVVDFLKEYKSIGGELDGIIVDLEYIKSTAWYIQDVYRKGDTELYRDIVKDPRYINEIKPRLKELGFDFSFEGKENTELWTIQYYDGSKVNPAYKATNASIWNTVIGEYQREAINKAVLYPLLEQYPDATVSDYQSGTYNPWNKAVGLHGGAEASFNVTGAGNMSNQNSYNGRPSYAVGRDLITPPGYNDAFFAASPFATAQYDVNLFKNMYASIPDGKIDAWIAHYWYGQGTKDYASTFTETPYYTENMLHIGLLNPKPFLGYLITAEVEPLGYTIDEAVTIVSDIMAELTRVAGASDRKPIQIPQTAAFWNAGYILSGMYAAGRNIWRITPDTSVVSLEDFKIEGKDPTFSVDGLTITFPGGKIVEDGKIDTAGSCGYWIETPADAEPVITGAENRYKDYPSLYMTFDDYAADSAFTSSVALPNQAWKVSGTAKIQENGSGNALALSGTTSVKNIKIVENITAGDAYAKQQAWEVTVTLPSNLNESAQIELLTCHDLDKGVKIEAGKVYYSNAGKYQQLEGVTLSADTAYTIRRELDFRNSSAFTSDFAVYDAAGNLLGQVNDVKVTSFDLPVTQITISTANANAPILIDDYKLYPTGVSTVLELYDAKVGNILNDQSAERSADTAYRMSWMNTSNEEVNAQIYDIKTGEVVETVVMAPNMDGYVTGIVKLSAEKSMQLAVKTDAKPESEPPVEGSTDGTTGPDGEQNPAEPSGSVENTTAPDADNTVATPTDGTDADGEKPGGKKFVWIVALCVVLLGGGFAAYWFLVKPKVPAKKSTVNTADQPDESNK